MTESKTIAAPKILLDWFVAHRRDLPWRTARGVVRDPWETLVSEVMSQQTRLDVVVPRFQDWMQRFPSPAHLAKLPEHDVLAAWAGLGYYSRARNLHKAAKAIAASGWPADHAGYLALPGVGPYTAAALASLCRLQRVPMIDGNVLRVLSRVHALGQDLRNGAGKRHLETLAAQWVSVGDAGEINEATMELGAMLCLPRNAKCGSCPLADSCKACGQGEPERFPMRKSRPEQVAVVGDVAVLVRQGAVVLRPSRSGELLRGLYVPPELSEIPPEVEMKPCGEVHHVITNHKVLWRVHTGQADTFPLPDGWVARSGATLRGAVVSSLVRKVLELAKVLA